MQVESVCLKNKNDGFLTIKGVMQVEHYWSVKCSNKMFNEIGCLLIGPCEKWPAM